MKDVYQMLSGLDAGKVLDAATGRGEFIRVIKNNMRSYDQIIGIDMNEAAVNQAQNLFPENNIEIYKMNLYELSFADGYFDTVCMSNSLHHLEYPDKVINELMRVLKPGGSVILVEMYKDGKQSQAQETHIQMHHWISRIDRLNGVYHRETYLKNELQDFIHTLPLDNIEIVDFYIPVDNPKDPVEIAPLIKNVQDWIKRCDSCSIAEDICSEGHRIIERMNTYGCVSASKLLIIAKKK